jgi:hypothetical protein
MLYQLSYFGAGSLKQTEESYSMERDMDEDRTKTLKGALEIIWKKADPLS